MPKQTTPSPSSSPAWCTGMSHGREPRSVPCTLGVCVTLRFSSPITLPPSPESPEPLGELPNIGIAIPRELFKGRPCGGVEDVSKNDPFPCEDGRGS